MVHRRVTHSCSLLIAHTQYVLVFATMLLLIPIILSCIGSISANPAKPPLRRLLFHNFDLHPFRVDSREVTISNGRLIGTADDRSESFLGIPYALPPVMHRRFMRPVSIEGTRWAGVRQARMTGPMCMQHAAFFRRSPIVGNEDCLYLNVYRPVNTTPDSNLPVMVFIPGGAFAIGSTYWLDGQFDGSTLATEQNVVVVVLAYRLHLFGFLATEQLQAANGGTVGNLALQDQQEALRWVKREISNFGGNPSSTLLFGESAGGFSVVWHTVNRNSARENLFSSVVAQSATSDLSWFFQSKEDAFQLHRAFTEYLGCPSSDLNQLSCLQEYSAHFLMKAWGRWSKVLFATDRSQPHREHHPEQMPMLHDVCAFGAVIDGHEDGLLEAPYALIKRGEFHRVPLLAGITKDEGSLFGYIIPHIVDSSHSRHTVKQWMEIADSIVQKPASIRSLYSLYPLRVLGGIAAAQTWATEIVRDFVFGCSTEEMIADWGKFAPSYAYLFSSTMGWVGKLIPLGAMHSFDVSYIFRNFPPGTGVLMSERDGRVATEMGARWASMARTGTPNPMEGGAYITLPDFNSSQAILEFGFDAPAEANASRLLDARAIDKELWPDRTKCEFWRTQRPLPWISHREHVRRNSTVEEYLALVTEKLGLVDMKLQFNSNLFPACNGSLGFL